MFVETFKTDVVFIGKVIMHLTSYGPIIFRMKVKVNNSLLVAKCATANISCIFRMRISSTNIQKTNFNKGNAKHGISPCLKIWPGDLDLWPWKSIEFQIFLRTKHVPSLVKIHWRMLILECSQRCYRRTDGRMEGRKVALLYSFATSLARG